jgi:hypothetical protein
VDHSSTIQAGGTLAQKKPQPKIVAKNVARWVHTLGLEVGRKFRKDPNHAWRHLFSSFATDTGMPKKLYNEITGRAPTDVGEGYGKTWLVTAARAIAKIPVPSVEELDQQELRPRRALQLTGHFDRT